MDHPLYGPTYEYLQNGLKKAFPNTSEAMSQVVPNIADGYAQSGAGGAVGQAISSGAGTLAAFGQDTARSFANASRPIAQAAKTALTGNSAPIGAPEGPAAVPAKPAVAQPVQKAGPAAAATTAATAPIPLVPEQPKMIDYARSSRAEGQRMGLSDMRVLDTGPYAEQGGIIMGKDKFGRPTMVGVSNDDVAARERARVERVTKDSIAESNMKDAYIAATYGEKGAKERVAAMPKPKSKLEQMAEAVQTTILDPNAPADKRLAAALTMKQFLGKEDSGEYKVKTDETVSPTGEVKKTSSLYNSKTGEVKADGKRVLKPGTPDYKLADEKSRKDFLSGDKAKKAQINAYRASHGMSTL